jgi:hypothetical protein
VVEKQTAFTSGKNKCKVYAVQALSRLLLRCSRPIIDKSGKFVMDLNTPRVRKGADGKPVCPRMG